MEDLEGLTGLKRTKGGSKDTEPAYIISRRNCGRWVGIVVLTLCVLGVVVWRNDSLLRRISPRLARKRAEIRREQHSAHSRFTKLGQELEQHLELDMREREVALMLRARLRVLEKTHRLNITHAMTVAALSSEAVSTEARDAMAPFLDGAIDSLFKELRDVLEARIVSPMLATSTVAFDRHRALHEEILEELREDAKEREKFVDRHFNEHGDIDGDGFVERNWEDELDDPDAAERHDEEWRRDVIENFAASFRQHFNDTSMEESGLRPRALLTTKDPLYREIEAIRDGLGGVPAEWDGPNANASTPQLSWQDAEKKLADLKPRLQKVRAHDFVPSEPPEDDQFDYVQLHNVERYLSDLLWHAKLNAKHDEIDKAIKEYETGTTLTSMALMEILETYAGDHTFPGFWLFQTSGYFDAYDAYAYAADW